MQLGADKEGCGRSDGAAQGGRRGNSIVDGAVRGGWTRAQHAPLDGFLGVHDARDVLAGAHRALDLVRLELHAPAALAVTVLRQRTVVDGRLARPSRCLQNWLGVSTGGPVSGTRGATSYRTAAPVSADYCCGPLAAATHTELEVSESARALSRPVRTGTGTPKGPSIGRFPACSLSVRGDWQRRGACPTSMSASTKSMCV